MSTEGIDDLVPVGYKACRDCGEFLVDGTRQARNNRCDPCQRNRTNETTNRVVTFEAQGRIFEHRPTQRRTPKRRVSKKMTAKEIAVERARRRAWRQLAHIYAPQFELLFATAKAEEGLDPRLDLTAQRSMETRRALLADISEAEEREDRKRQARQLHSA